ncbi:MAG: acyloxyacyl hydrolase [Woeseia sp.]
MKDNHLASVYPARHRYRHVIVFMAAMASLSLQSSNARAATLVPDDYRVGKVVSKFDDTWQIAAAFRLRSPRRLRAQYLEFAVGATTTPRETRAFVSMGPVWRFPVYRDRISIKLGFSPTLLAGSVFGGRDMGGKVHFTSSAAVEAALGVRRSASLALRIQHTSNGSLNSTNPGMDIVGLSFGYRFDQ